MALALFGRPVDALPVLVAAELQSIAIQYTKAPQELTLETKDGKLTGASAILRFVGRFSAVAGLQGQNAVEAAQVDQWIDFAASDIQLPPLLQEAIPMMRTLANIGVQGSLRQTSARAAVAALTDVTKSLTALNTVLATRTYLVGDSITLADLAVATAAHDVFTLFLEAAVRTEVFPHIGRWLGTVTALPQFASVAEQLSFITGGKRRIGGQIDLRPSPVRVSALADASVGRNTGAKKVESQRQAEKAKKGGDGPFPTVGAAATAAAPAPVAAAAPVAPSAGGGVSEVVLDAPKGPARVAAALEDIGLKPAREENPRTDVARPFGHSTHNLFVRDKKVKDAFFLVTLRQDRELNLTALAKLVGVKEVRFAAPEDTAQLLGCTGGCITPLWLVNDTEGKVQAVWDAAILDLPTIRVCAGCADAKDHTQHNVVDITPAQLRALAQAGSRPEPKLATL